MDNMKTNRKRTNTYNSKRVGTPYDIDRCFFIKDFRRGDSIRVKVAGVITRGVVKDIDLDTMEVVYNTSDEAEARTVLNHIVSLEEHQKGWLN
jgi:hypothetical protein